MKKLPPSSKCKSVSLIFRLTVTLCLICFGPAGFSQQLFTPITDVEASLTIEQQAKLDSLRLIPAYASITMVQVGDLPNLQYDGRVKVKLPDMDTMEAIAYKVENPSLSD